LKASIQLYKNDKITKGGYPVKLILSHERKTRRKTIAHSLEEDWDPVAKFPLSSHDDFEDLYIYISEIKKKSVKIDFSRITDFDTAFSYLLGDSRIYTKSFYDFAQLMISEQRKQGREGNAVVYENAVNAFKSFSAQLNFSEITIDFLDRFKAFQKEKGNQNSTIKNYIGEVKAIYNKAVRRGLVENSNVFEGVFSDIKVRARRKKQRYLTRAELEKLQKADLSPSYQRAVDLALLQFYLGGVDLIDLYYLKHTDFHKNRVFFKRSKMNSISFEFDLLVPQLAETILNNYKVEGEYIFPWRKDYLGYKTFRDNHTRNLKKVQQRLGIELSPRNDNLTSKVMRHTFATLAKFERIEEDLIRELMGHERNDVDTIYKDKYPEAERNAAQLKILGIKSTSVKPRKVRKAKMKVKRK